MAIINLKLPSFVAFAIVLGVAAIAGTLIFVMSEQEMPGPGNGPAVTLPPVASEKSAEGDDEFAGWQTYHNEEYGFELRYPSDWSTKELGSDPVDEVIISKGGSQLRIDPDGNGGTGVWFTETEQSQIIVSGVRGERIEYLTTDTKETFSVWIKFIGYNNNGWDPVSNNIVFRPRLEDLGSSTIADPRTDMQVLKYRIFDLEILDQIFSTFRFIE